MAQLCKRRAFLMGLTLTGCQSARDSRPAPADSPRVNPSAVELPDVDPAPGQSQAGGSIPQRRLGVTGEEVSMLGLGGYHIGIPGEAEAIRIMHRAIDEGLTFFDNCWDYHEGESERRMGKALSGGKRQRVFLMTKIDGRTKQAALRQLEDSLHRLRVDHVDLVQVHEVIREKDPEWVFGEDGAIEALRQAQTAGKLSYIGFTGHKSPEIHLEMLRVAARHDFRFDTVQLPLNPMDPHFKSFEKKVLPVLLEQHIAVLGMKPLASGDIVKSGNLNAEQCLRYALSLPTSVVITGIDSMPVLEQALRVARSFEPLDEAEKRALLERSKPLGRTGELEAFKTTQRFDATEKNPHWLTSGKI